MSIVTKTILKGYFETGDRPTEGQFIDLIDSIVTLTHANTGDVTIVGTLTVDNINIGSHISASRVSASGGFEADTLSTSSFGYISSSGDISTSGNIFAREGVLETTNVSASSFTNIYSLSHITSSGNISASGDVIGFTGSFHYLEGDGSGLTNVHVEDVVHGNKVSVTGSQKVTSNTNNTVATNNTGEFTIPIGANYTVETGGQVDLQYTPIAERLYRYDVDTGTFKAYAQANIDSETTLIKGFGASTAGVGNDSTVRHNATVPENFVTILHTTTNVTQSEDPNNNPMTTDPHSITIQDQSTYTIKQGADVTVDGVHHGVIRKDIALFSTLGIGDTQAIGPTGSEHFNDQLARIYPSASAHLHISASDPRVIVEATFGAPEVSLLNSSSNHAGFLSFKEGSNKRSDDKWESEFRFSYNANEATKPFRLQQINKTGSPTRIFQIFSGSSANALTITGSRIGIGTMDPQATLYVEGDISASGTVTALSGSFSELSGMSPLTVNGETIFTGPITASGDVSSSGNIDVNQINSRGQRVATFDGQQMLLGSNSINTSIVGASIFLGPVLGAITASGEISSSSDITGVTGSFEGGLVLTSPNGTKYRFTTNDSGHLSLTGSAV